MLETRVDKDEVIRKKFYKTFASELTDEISKRIYLDITLDESNERIVTLLISEELKGNSNIQTLVSRYDLLYIVHKVDYVFHTEFDQKYKDKINLEHNKAYTKYASNVKDLLQVAYDLKASDIHIDPSFDGTIYKIRFRILGFLRDYSSLTITEGTQTLTALYNTMTVGGGGTFIGNIAQDGRIADRDFLPPNVSSVRLHTEPIQCMSIKDQSSGIFPCIKLRLLYDATETKGTLSERMLNLGFLHEQIALLKKLSNRTGLFLVAGPTGSGKSTMLKHFIESMYEDKPYLSYMSIEDPVEQPILGVTQILVGGGSDFDEEDKPKAFSKAIAGALRSDPDKIYIGEIRHGFAARNAVSAARTGHATVATIHATNAFEIIERMAELMGDGISSQQIIDSICKPSILAGLVTQRLVPILCEHCKMKWTDCSQEDFEKLGYDEEKRSEVLRLFGGEIDKIYIKKGCELCNHVGYSSRKVVAEVVYTDHTLLNLIRTKRETEAFTYFQETLGGISYTEAAKQLITNGEADPIDTQEIIGDDLNSHIARKGDRS